jgi:serine protease Do
MNNDNWYNTDSCGWYEPMHGENSTTPAPVAHKKKSGWTKTRVWGLVILILVLIVGSSLVFARHSSVSLSWNNNGEKGSWSSDGDSDSSSVDDLPDSKEDFFDSYYTSTEDDSATEINIPTVTLESNFSLELQSAEGDTLELNELYERCAPSIVAIYGYIDGETGYYWGTGVVLSEDGLILTNTHVIDGCDSATVKLNDDSEYEAQLVGADSISDIAILKIDASGLTPAEFGESSQLAVGDKVAAIGNPLGETFRATMTDGIISAIERGINYKGRSMTLLQTNTALNEGNSGGALFNMYGQVIGITNMKMMSSYSSIEGIGFAIPTSTVKTVVNSLLQYGEVKGRPSIGITVGAIPEYARDKYDIPEGLYVSAVQENSDAARQGIQVGDIITAVNYQAVTTTDEVNEIKNTLEVGDLMIFTIWRDGETFDVEVALMETNDLYK